MLLGRPGCGKSLIFKLLKEYFSEEKIAKEFSRIDDFPILQKLLEEDTKALRHEKKDGGFAVTDWSIIDDVLKEMNSIVLDQVRPDKMLFIEFSRANYREALKNFTREFLDNTIILYIKTSFDICLKRNEDRYKNTEEKNIDDHIVPPDLMHAYYKNDDFELILTNDGEKELKSRIKMPIFVLDNNSNEIKLLRKDLSRFVDYYKKSAETGAV